MRMENPDQLQAPLSGLTFRSQQILGSQFISLALLTLIGVFERDSLGDTFFVAPDMPQHGPTAFIGIGTLGMQNHGLPRLGFNLNHSRMTRSGIFDRHRIRS